MKIIFFDIDNTLTIDNSWERLNLAAGMTKEEDDDLYQKFHTGQCTYQSWTEQLEEQYRNHGLLNKTIANNALRSYTLHTSAKEIIATIYNRGYTPVLITGGFVSTAEAVGSDLGVETYYAATDITFTDKGIFQSLISHGEEGVAKLNLALEYVKNHDIDIKNCLAVGDSSNDIPLFEATGHGITFAWTKESVQRSAKYIINDLSDLENILNANDLHLS